MSEGPAPRTITEESGKDLGRPFDLPVMLDADKAEGRTIYDGLGVPGLMIVYDSPSPAHKPDKGTILADVYRLPGH